MLIYVFLAIFLGIQVLFTSQQKKTGITRNKYIYVKNKNIQISLTAIWISIDILVLMLIVLFRDKSIGTDYRTYYSIISELKNTGFGDIFRFANSHYIEVGFCFFTKACLSIWNEPLFVFAVIYLIIFISVVYFAKSNNVSEFFALYLFVTFSMYNQSFNVLRQYFAAALILLMIIYATKDKVIASIILFLLAISIHSSAFIGIVFLPLCFIKTDISKFCIAFVFISLIISKIGLPIIHFLVRFSGYEKYLYKELSSETGIGLIMNIIFFAIFIYFKNNMENKKNYNIWLLSATLSVSLNFFIGTIGMIARMMIYTKIFYVVSLQDFILSFKSRKYREISQFIIISLFMIYYIFSVSGSCFGTSPYKSINTFIP